jgi:hypothetical protein
MSRSALPSIDLPGMELEIAELADAEAIGVRF